MKKLAIFVCFGGALFCFSCGINRCFGIKDDSHLEEAIEKVVEHHSGLDVDLTPETPEGLIPRRGFKLCLYCF